MSEVTNEEIMRMITSFEKFVKADWRKQSLFGIKASEVRLLMRIKDLSQSPDQKVTVTDLSNSLAVTSPTITQMIKSLSTNGYVERITDMNDRRVAVIRLTAKGEDIVQKLTIRRFSITSGLIENLGKEQSEVLISLLNQVYDYYDKANKVIE